MSDNSEAIILASLERADEELTIRSRQCVAAGKTRINAHEFRYIVGVHIWNVTNVKFSRILFEPRTVIHYILRVVYTSCPAADSDVVFHYKRNEPESTPFFFA